MIKHHKLVSFCIGLGFLIVLQKFANPEPIFRFLLPAFLVYGFAVTLYNYWYLQHIQKYNFWILLKPILLMLSAFGIFLILPSEIFRNTFLIVTVFVIALFEVILGNYAENLLLNETLMIAFGLFFSFFAAFHYAPAYETYYLAGVFVGSALLARTFYEFVPQSGKTKILGSLAIGLFCSELFWVLNFLQFHFSTLAVFLFNLFYFCLIVNYYHLFYHLNFKKLQFHLFLIAGCSLVVLIFTPWSVIQ